MTDDSTQPIGRPGQEHEGRSDPRRRRARLRALDVVLGEELEDAGALSLAEFLESPPTQKVGGREVSEETLREWWSYALRRRLLEPVAIEGVAAFSLSDRGRDAVARARREGAVSISPEIRAAVRYVVPSGAAALVVSIASVGTRDPSVWTVAAGAAVLVAFLLMWAALLDLVVGRVIDPRLDRALIRRSVCWLESEAVQTRVWWIAEPAVDATRVRRLTAAVEPSETALSDVAAIRQPNGRSRFLCAIWVEAGGFCAVVDARQRNGVLVIVAVLTVFAVGVTQGQTGIRVS